MPIVVAGYTGLAGSAIFNLLRNSRKDVVGIDSKVVNLLNESQTLDFIMDLRPSIVIDAAAMVGGIGANNKFPVEFLSKNLKIQLNLMEASHLAKVERYVFLGSSCIYPNMCRQPIKEEYLHTGQLEPTNSAYAMAKLSGLELVKSYRKQFNYRWLSLMPTNLYGPNDNFSLENGHVLPALIQKFVVAREQSQEFVSLWGSGIPKREFLHSTDLADAIVFLIENYDDDSHINVGSGEEISIRELADLIAEESGYDGEVCWDKSKPDGTKHKLLDSSRIRRLGWKPKVGLRDGVRQTISWFRKNRSTARL